MCNPKLIDPYLMNSDRRIRCNLTNSFTTPAFMDTSQAEERYAELEARLSPLMKPRFHDRERLTAQPVYHPYPRQSELFRVVFFLKGGGLLLQDSDEDSLLAPGTFMILPAGVEADVLLSRGVHHAFLGHWEPESTYIVTDQINSLKTFILADCSPVLQLFTANIAENPELAANDENLLHSWLNLVVSEAANLPESRSYSLLPNLGREVSGLDDLIRAIKANPENDWNLNAAADFAGYSPFHLSRTFRASIGIGLPGFVELCRTETAIDRLLKTNDPINVIACECGFGSSQAMRSAIREFTGLLPTEIRGRAGE